MKKKANMKSIHLRKKSLIDFIRTFKKLNKNKDIPSRQVKSTQKDKAPKAYQFMLDIEDPWVESVLDKIKKDEED
tara:strand:+ start:195 stop:419 length:225 start_codon:yes stop_codon:yes gene_type:complete